MVRETVILLSDYPTISITRLSSPPLHYFPPVIDLYKWFSSVYLGSHTSSSMLVQHPSLLFSCAQFGVLSCDLWGLSLFTYLNFSAKCAHRALLCFQYLHQLKFILTVYRHFPDSKHWSRKSCIHLNYMWMVPLYNLIL